MGELHHTFWGWVIGLGLVSGLLGRVVTLAVWIRLRQSFHKMAEEKKWELKEEDGTTGKTPHTGRLLGPLERAFFTLLTAFEISGLAGAIPAWMAVKLVSGWNRISKDGLQHRFIAFNSLTCSLVSMFFAVVGGLIANGQIPVYLLWERHATDVPDLSQELVACNDLSVPVGGVIDAPTVFMLFFAIVWSAIANAQTKWKPFHWPAIRRVRQARCRLLLSFGFLNVLPLVLFCLCVSILASDQNRVLNLTDWGTIRLVLSAVLPAWGVFGCYRMWLGVIELKPESFYPLTKESLPRDYDDVEPTVEKLWEKEGQVTPAQPFRPKSAVSNLVCGAAYIVLSLGSLAIGVLTK